MVEPRSADYVPIRPPLSARWAEWSALLRPFPECPDSVIPDSILRAAAAAGPVVVLPGLARGDSQTVRLRRHLGRTGFQTSGWGLGIDIGPTPRVLDGLSALLLATAKDGGPANLVGLSMGGLFARWLAHRHPSLVRQVITVGSPFRSPLDSFFLPLRHIAAMWPGDTAAFVKAVERRPPVAATSLYTMTDGTVAWQSCLDPDTPERCHMFVGPHVTMAANPAVWSLVVQRLL